MQRGPAIVVVKSGTREPSRASSIGVSCEINRGTFASAARMSSRRMELQYFEKE
jgi:hypothetical protein